MTYAARMQTSRARAAQAMLSLAMTGTVPVSKTTERKPLYVARQLKNPEALTSWAKSQGIPNIVDGGEMHVTVLYSKAPVDWFEMGQDYSEELKVDAGGPRDIAMFGQLKRDVLVLRFASDNLDWRHRHMLEHGASSDFSEYRPHVTIAIDVPEDFDWEAVEPYQGKLIFGPEIFDDIDEDWKATLRKYNTAQPRNRLGQWSAGSGGGFGMGAAGEKLTAPQLGIGSVAPHRFKENPQQAAFMAPLTQSELTGKPAYLGNPYGYVDQNPQTPSNTADNGNPEDTATFVAGVDPGEGLNGVPFKPWDGPEGGDWTKVDGEGSFDEPDLPDMKGKRLGAGVVIEEPDGRIWTINPLNSFGGYNETLPKGGIEEGLNLRQTAIKEAWEESGLKVELTGYIGDFERTTSVARYYRAKRVGGDPTDFHWETAATNLVPKEGLNEALHHPSDKPLLGLLNGEPASVVKMKLAFADLYDLFGDDVLKAKKAWSTQPRVPAGLPTGGQWSKGGYGGGGWGAMFAENGLDLELQKHKGTGKQAEDLNNKIQTWQDAANNGELHPGAAAYLGKDKIIHSYSGPAWESAQEVKSYLETKAAVGTKPKPTEKAPAASKAAAGTPEDPVKLSAMTQTGPKPGGSAQGAVYTDKDGTKWLVKSYKTSDQAYNEVAASKMYAAMGVETPEMKIVDLEGSYLGGHGVMSKMIDDLQPFDKNNPAHMKAAQTDFAAHAVLANWDAVGLSYDNILIKPNGKAVMIDPGGSLLYRAQGTPKGTAFGTTVTEIDTLRDPLKNPTAAVVFGKMTASEIVHSMQEADFMAMANGKLSPAMAKAIDSSFPKGSKVAADLKAKMNYRFQNMEVQKSKIEASLASTSKADLSTTGTKTPTYDHPNPNVKQLALAQDAQIKDFIDNNKAGMTASVSALSGQSEGFYTTKIKDLGDKAAAGDIDGINQAFYEPATGTAKLSDNYGQYKKAHAAALNVAYGVEAQKLKTQPPEGAGGMTTGKSKLTAGEIDAAKKTSGSKSVATDTSYDANAAVLAAKANTPKPVSPTVLTPPPAMPMKLVKATATNPNTKLLKMQDEIESIAKSGAPDAVAQIKGISDQVTSGQTYNKKLKEYAANVIAALGGEAAYDALPSAVKAKGVEKGIAAGTKIKTQYGVKMKETKELIQFDPDTVPKPPDFNAYGASGTPLSSNKAFNDDNNAKVNAVYAKAIQNDVNAVKAMDVSSSFANPQTGTVTANKHVTGYKQHVADYLDNYNAQIGTYQRKVEFVGMESNIDPAKAAGSIGKAMKAKSVWAPGVEKLAGYAVAGNVGKDVAKSLYDAIPEVFVKPHSAQAANLKVKTYAQTVEAQKAMAAHTGKGSSTYGWSQMNAALFTQKPGDPVYDAALKNANSISKGVYEMPTGMVVGRKINQGSFAEWQSAEGKVISSPGVLSASINPGVWGGSVGLKIKFSEGAKAAYVGQSAKAGTGKAGEIGLGSEQEVILPRGIKFIVANVKKDDGKDSYFGKDGGVNTIVEVIAVLHDDDTA